MARAKPDADSPTAKRRSPIGDKDKKQEQDRKDKALVERAARQVAFAGWRHAKAESGSRVLSHRDRVRRQARGARAAGVRVDVDVVGTGGSWRVKAKATVAKTPAQLEAITQAHVKKVYERLAP